MFENEEDYMSYVESVSLRPYMEEDIDYLRECREYNFMVDQLVNEKYHLNSDSSEFKKFLERGEIIIKEDSDIVEDFISPS